MTEISFSQMRQLIRLDMAAQWVFTQNKTSEGHKNFTPDPEVSGRYWNGDWTKPPIKKYAFIAHWSKHDGMLYVGRFSNAPTKPNKSGRIKIPMDFVTAYKVSDFSPELHTLMALLSKEIKGLGDQCTYWPSNPSSPKGERTQLNSADAFDDEVAIALADSGTARRKRLSQAPTKAQKVLTSVFRFLRNPDVVAEVLIRADGKCEQCLKRAPFKRKTDKTPYLEVHHIKQLAEDGLDEVKNAVALCPNCHRQSHFGLGWGLRRRPI